LYHDFDQPLALASGKVLPQYRLVYETYGQLNNSKNNALLVCHALSGDHHAAGYHNATDSKPGWWDVCIGPGKPLDTERFFVVAVNNLGGCNGSTGPNSTNPATGQCYGADFPIVTVTDWVNTQARLADMLGIDQWAAVIGGSLGGMQALQWAMSYPERLHHALVIASAAKLTAQNIAFNTVARQIIAADPEFHQGHYQQHQTRPKSGLKLARMLAHITYLSDQALGQKFGRELRANQLNYDYQVEFEVESYLRYQGERFSSCFDANTYRLMTKALDYFDPAASFDNSLTKALEQTRCGFLVLSFSSDWRFSPAQSTQIVNALIEARKAVCYANVTTQQGHDAFLLAIPRYLTVLKAYLNKVALELALD
jgi:homoserine O-acetyltransferase